MFRALRNFLLLSLIFLILPTFCLAQSINTAASLQNELGVEISPDYPGPNEKVSISLSLFTDDLNSATIVWYLNDQKVLEGVGETKYSFKMGQAGKSTKVDIKIKLLSGVSFSKTFTLNPASVDLVWEANSYVPPFYKGKALFSYQSSFKIVATPNFIRNGKLIPAEKLVYEWSNNNSAYQNQSGYGKNVLILNGSVLGREEEIDLLVTDPNSNLVANGFINLRPTEPEIVFYQNDPYYGQIFDNTSSNIFDLKKEEIQFWVAPYYFSKEDLNRLSYKWQLNNESVPNLSNSRTAIFKKPEATTGRSAISLSIENINRILQQANQSLIINFEK